MRKSIVIIGAVLIFGLAGKSQAQGDNSDYQYALIEAVKQKNLGNIPGAIELYNMVIQENDSVAIAHYELGTLYLMVKRPILAEDQFLRAYEQDPSNEWYLNGYIEALVIREKYDDANELIKKALPGVEDPLEYKFKSANIYFLSGENRKALGLLKKIEKKYGISQKVIVLKAQIFEKEEKYKKGLAELNKLIRYFPEYDRYLVAAAEMALKSGQNDLSNKYYTEVYKLDSTNIYALTNLTDYYRKLGQHRKSLYFLKKSFESMYIDYEKKLAIISYYLTDPFYLNLYSEDLGELVNVLLELYPDKPEIKHYSVDYYIHQQDYLNAFETIKPLLTKETRNYEVWKQGILLANALSKNEELLTLTSEAVLIFPDSTEITYFKGIAEFENNMFEEVVKTFSSELITKNKNQDIVSQTKQILAESYQKLGMYEEASTLFRIIIKEEPNNYLVINNFSYYLALRGESLEEARKLSSRMILDNPENGTFLDTYAWVLYMIGDYQEAEKYINKALQKGGLNDPDVNEHAAEIHLKLGSYHVARSFYEKAIILGGDKEKLTEKISYLGTLYEK